MHSLAKPIFPFPERWSEPGLPARWTVPTHASAPTPLVATAPVAVPTRAFEAPASPRPQLQPAAAAVLDCSTTCVAAEEGEESSAADGRESAADIDGEGGSEAEELVVEFSPEYLSVRRHAAQHRKLMHSEPGAIRAGPAVPSLDDLARACKAERQAAPDYGSPARALRIAQLEAQVDAHHIAALSHGGQPPVWPQVALRADRRPNFRFAMDELLGRVARNNGPALATLIGVALARIGGSAAASRTTQLAIAAIGAGAAARLALFLRNESESEYAAALRQRAESLAVRLARFLRDSAVAASGAAVDIALWKDVPTTRRWLALLWLARQLTQRMSLESIAIIGVAASAVLPRLDSGLLADVVSQATREVGDALSPVVDAYGPMCREWGAQASRLLQRCSPDADTAQRVARGAFSLAALSLLLRASPVSLMLALNFVSVASTHAASTSFGRGLLASHPGAAAALAGLAAWARAALVRSAADAAAAAAALAARMQASGVAVSLQEVALREWPGLAPAAAPAPVHVPELAAPPSPLRSAPRVGSPHRSPRRSPRRGARSPRVPGGHRADAEDDLALKPAADREEARRGRSAQLEAECDALSAP